MQEESSCGNPAEVVIEINFGHGHGSTITTCAGHLSPTLELLSYQGEWAETDLAPPPEVGDTCEFMPSWADPEAVLREEIREFLSSQEELLEGALSGDFESITELIVVWNERVRK
jgi:hypothetical protein